MGIDKPLPEMAREIEAEETAPLSKVEETLLVNIGNDFATRAVRLDDLAKQLIALSIAVPSLYAAVLKLTACDSAGILRAEITFGPSPPGCLP